MPKFNYFRIARLASRLIDQFGARCVLRRDSGDRDCIAVETDYTPRERQAVIGNVPRMFLVSVDKLLVPPDKEQDYLVTFHEDGVTENEVLRLASKPGRLAPARTVIYYELAVEDGP